MAHVAKIVAGLSGLYISDINGTGLVSSAVWELLGKNLEGTFSLTQADATVTEIYVEESDNPILEVLKAGKKSFTTSIPDLAFEIAERLFGATKSIVVVEGVSLTRVALPDSAAYIYKMFKIVPTQGVEQFYFAKGQINAKINGNLSKTETVNIDLTVTALTPDSGENAVMYDIASGTNPGYLLGGTLAPTALDTLIGQGAAGLTLTVDGGTAQDVNDLDFTGETTWDECMAVLNAGFDDATFSFDEDEFRIKVTSDSTGSGSTIALADGGSGTEIRGATMLNTSSSTPVVGS